jgi:hypothetical protein
MSGVWGVVFKQKCSVITFVCLLVHGKLKNKSKLTHPILQIIAILQIHLLQTCFHHAAKASNAIQDFQLFQSTDVLPVCIQPVEHDIVGADVSALPNQLGLLEILQIMEVQVLGVIKQQEDDFGDGVPLLEYPGQ